MFYILLQWDAWQKILLKTLFVSIPEELFLVMFTLILVGEFEYWKEPECKSLINKFDYVRVFLPTILGALLSNILKYMGFESSFFQILTPIVMYIIIVLTNDIFGDASALKWMAKAFLLFMIGLLYIGISEFTYIPFVLYGTGLTIPEINNNFLLYFILSLPARLLQYSFLLYLIGRKRTLLKGGLIKNILSIPTLSFILSVLVVSNVLFLQAMVKAIVFDRVLKTISTYSQITIIICVVLIPMLSILGLFWGVFCVKNKENNDKRNAVKKISILTKNIKIYTNSENYVNIRWKLNEIGRDIEEVAESLYKEDETDKHKIV